MSLNSVRSTDITWVLQKPLLSEKAARLGSENVYSFEIHPDATKIDVMRAISTIYKVQPTRVNTVVTKMRAMRVRGRKGMQSGSKKAMVFLKKGDTINLI